MLERMLKLHLATFLLLSGVELAAQAGPAPTESKATSLATEQKQQIPQVESPQPCGRSGCDDLWANNKPPYDLDNNDCDQGKQGKAQGPLDVLSDTMGVDFGPYLARVLHDVKQNWYNLMPESAAMGKTGKVAIEFAILKDGRVAGMRLAQGGSSGDAAIDRSAGGHHGV
jgi:hypothetical protein